MNKRKNILVQLLVAVVVLLLVMYGSFISKELLVRITGCSFCALIFTMFHCLLGLNKRFLLFWGLLFLGSIVVWECYLEFFRTSYHGFGVVNRIEPRQRDTYYVVVNICDIPYSDQEAMFYVMAHEKGGFKKGDTLFLDYSLFSNGDLHSGITSWTRKYSDINKRRYLRPSSWYPMQFPERYFSDFGYNIVYKAILNSYGQLRFTNVLGKQCFVQYESKNYTSVPDTLLVFRNINENIDDRFIVCAPEVNTPENRAKISDYGYIFHYDVYSKEEIESQCPQIRNYVEKYKERMKAK